MIKGLVVTFTLLILMMAMISLITVSLITIINSLITVSLITIINSFNNSKFDSNVRTLNTLIRFFI